MASIVGQKETTITAAWNSRRSFSSNASDHIIWLFKLFSIFTCVLACDYVKEKPIEFNLKFDRAFNNMVKIDRTESQEWRLGYLYSIDRHFNCTSLT